MLTGDKRPTWTVYCHLPINLSPPLHLAFIPKIGDRLKTLNFQTVDSMIFCQSAGYGFRVEGFLAEYLVCYIRAAVHRPCMHWRGKAPGPDNALAFITAEKFIDLSREKWAKWQLPFIAWDALFSWLFSSTAFCNDEMRWFLSCHLWTTLAGGVYMRPFCITLQEMMPM